MTAAASPRFYPGPGSRCRRHWIARCRACETMPAPPVPPSLETQIMAVLDLLPLEEQHDDLRADLVRVRINQAGLDTPARRRLASQLIRFHVAAGTEPLRVQLHQIALEIERG